MICCLGDPLSHGSPVAVFVNRSHPCIWKSNSNVSVDVVRLESYANCPFDPASLIMRVTINKLYFFPEWLMSGVVGVLRNYGGQLFLFLMVILFSFLRKLIKTRRTHNSAEPTTKFKSTAVLPYVKVLSKQLHRCLQQQGVCAVFKSQAKLSSGVF